MKKKNFDNAKEVAMEYNGKVFSGRYVVNRRIITVTSEYGQKSTQLGGSNSQTIARLLLQELAIKSQIKNNSTNNES